ncbi:MAG TPA: hypothetical protein EYN51_01045 [Flavobacteriales bacterium]|nr:hypothetical protein [Flavobacteriales bacterium]HIA11486.1 hypothetical protein [Flavobacteriales bacterium]
MTKVKEIFLGTAVLFIIMLGYVEQFLFENVNHHLHYLYYKTELSLMSDKLSMLLSWNYDDLMWLKWGMTILSTILYFLATISVLHLIFKREKYIMYTIYLFVGVICISFILYMGGSLIGFPKEGYRLSRFAMGFLTSPIPLMALIPAFKLAKSSNS